MRSAAAPDPRANAEFGLRAEAIRLPAQSLAGKDIQRHLAIVAVLLLLLAGVYREAATRVGRGAAADAVTYGRLRVSGAGASSRRLDRARQAESVRRCVRRRMDITREETMKCKSTRS